MEITVEILDKGPEINIELLNKTMEVNVEVLGAGPPGTPGRTPQRGVDYWTEADKAEIVEATLAALPVYEGEAVVVG